MIPYLLLADFVNTGLSAFLAFSGGVLFDTYQTGPRLWGISPADDQVTAGVIMWVPGLTGVSGAGRRDRDAIADASALASAASSLAE